MIEAAFYTAKRLFGLQFKPRTDVPVWHPDVRVWEVLGSDGGKIGLFFGDYLARPSKQSGAWMTSLRDQEKLAGDIRPLIINVCNFSKGAEGEPTLLSFIDAHTLFHEFGHALHGLLSNVTYPQISGTSVATDFVELPSQLYEHWLEQPEILRHFALHYQTGEPMPEALLQRLIAARNFDQGFATVEYLASAFVDLDFHSLHRRRPRSIPPRSKRNRWRASACRTRSSCAIGRRTSVMCFQAAAMRPATTATCGRKCSTPTRSRPSRRPATFSIRQRPSGCATLFTPPAAPASRPTPTKPFVAGCRARMRCCASADFAEPAVTS